eukprot:scaffold23409_cov35-Phaeocystis_antarctica.AAC.2
MPKLHSAAFVPATSASCMIGTLQKMPCVAVSGDCSASPAPSPSMCVLSHLRSAGGTCLPDLTERTHLHF